MHNLKTPAVAMLSVLLFGNTVTVLQVCVSMVGICEGCVRRDAGGVDGNAAFCAEWMRRFQTHFVICLDQMVGFILTLRGRLRIQQLRKGDRRNQTDAHSAVGSFTKSHTGYAGRAGGRSGYARLKQSAPTSALHSVGEDLHKLSGARHKHRSDGAVPTSSGNKPPLPPGHRRACEICNDGSRVPRSLHASPATRHAVAMESGTAMPLQEFVGALKAKERRCSAELRREGTRVGSSRWYSVLRAGEPRPRRGMTYARFLPPVSLEPSDIPDANTLQAQELSIGMRPKGEEFDRFWMSTCRAAVSKCHADNTFECLSANPRQPLHGIENRPIAWVAIFKHIFRRKLCQRNFAQGRA